MKFLFLSLFLAFFALPNSAMSQTTELLENEHLASSFIITHVAVFNGRDSTILENRDVVIKDGIILKIASGLDVSKFPEADVIDGKGKTLMPGLIDAHVHLTGSGAVPWSNVKADIEYNLTAYLYAGITTVYDLGGIGKRLNKISKKVADDKFVGPSIYHTHIPISVKGSHPIPLTETMLFWPLKSMVNAISPTIDAPEDAPKIIKKYLKNDVDYVKIICDQIPPGSPEMTFEQMKALIDAAHSSNKKVFVHIGSPQNAVDAVNAGADVLAHGVWRGQLTPEQADIIAQSGIPVIYTAAGFENVSHIHKGEFEPSSLDSVLIPTKVLDPVTGENGRDVHHQEVMNAFFENVSENEVFWKENFKLLKTRGVQILVGTDSNLPGTYAGATYLQELQTLKDRGMSNFEVLTAATYLNAQLFIENPNFGSVEEGKKADLLLLKGNPLENLDFMLEPELLFKSGEAFKRNIQFTP